MTRELKTVLAKMRKRRDAFVEAQEWLQRVREAQAAGLPQPVLEPGGLLGGPRPITKDDIID